MGATYVGNANRRPCCFCHRCYEGRAFAVGNRDEVLLCRGDWRTRWIRRGQVCARDLSLKHSCICNARTAADVSQWLLLKCGGLHIAAERRARSGVNGSARCMHTRSQQIAQVCIPRGFDEGGVVSWLRGEYWKGQGQQVAIADREPETRPWETTRGGKSASFPGGTYRNGAVGSLGECLTNSRRASCAPGAAASACGGVAGRAEQVGFDTLS